MEWQQTKTSNLYDLLTCTICLETFTEPKYLPCLHTFCKTCINTYILSTVKKEKSQTTFKCPICRQNVLMGESAENPQIWADKLLGIHFVASMMDRQAIRRREKYATLVKCEEAFCESCEKCHKSFRMTARHPTILMKDIINNKELVNTSCLIYCEEHPGEVVKAYCVDHSEPICTLCATLSHRKCKDVTTVEVAASGIKESQKVKELSAKLTGMSKQLSDLIQNRKEHTVDFEKEADAAFRRVSTIKDNIVKHLNTIEEQIKGEINKSKKEVVLKLSDKSTELESLKSTVGNWVTIFDICLQHGSELQCSLEIELKKIRTTLVIYLQKV
ncbi:E3 ubiquitin-protein ligase TRIM45-like [Mytilus galloprovincialis]|uniref:E3 ubiquitin-protein ligase TRIM45-like n=1 Tax=Mytilus galloprovincialis TaxID=29158 RepID=UPI003F7B6DB5